MELFNSGLGRNITFVRPAYFIIRGFIGIPNMKYYYVFLFFVYIVSVVVNSAVMALICLDHNLRTPKYIAVFNLAFVDLCGSSVMVPKVLDIFLFNHHIISYNDCLTFLFFSYTFLSMQALNLVALAYDRLIAIIYPLHYQVKVTNRFMVSLITSFWVFVISVLLIATGLLTRLSICDSVVINSYFCDHGRILRLACNDNSPSDIIAYLLPVIIIWIPLVFIVLTYLSIGYALTKVATFQERVKAFKTCSGHLSLVAIYFLPILIIFTFGMNFDANTRIINVSLSSVIPPMLNPIVYVLQTQEIRVSVKKILNSRLKSKVTGRKVIMK